MPASSDRFDEAIFFAKRALEEPAHHSNINELNWLVGAHLTAFIGITDAAKIDYERAGREFRCSPFELEVKLLPDEDPVSANRAYRDLRNLRTHFAVPLVVLEQRCLVYDIARGEGDRPKERWYFKRVDWELVRQLNKPRLCELDVVRFNRYLNHHPIIDVMGQMLFVAYAVLNQSARELDA